MDSASIGAIIVAGQAVALSGTPDLLRKYFPRGTDRIRQCAEKANSGLSAVIFPLIRDRFDDGVVTLEEQTQRDLEKLGNPKALLLTLVLETPEKKKRISVVAGEHIKRVHPDSFWKEKLVQWALFFKKSYEEGFMQAIGEAEKVLKRTFPKTS